MIPRDASSDRRGPSERLGRAALAAGIAVHILFLISLVGTHWLDPLFLETRGIYGQASDYFGIYQAGDNLLEGRSIYAREGRPEGDARQVPYFYFYRYLPPAAYVAALDAALLPPWPAYWLWVATNEALLVLLLASMLRLRTAPRGTRWILAAIALGFFPFYLEQWMGQFSFLMGVFLWFTLRPEIAREGPPASPERFGGLPRRAEFWCWTAAVGLKNFPALFAFPYLRQGRWRRVLLAAALVVLVCAPYYIARPADAREFLALNLLRPLPPAILGGSFGLVSLVRDLGWRMPEAWASTVLRAGPMDVYVGNLPVFASNALVVALTVWATWRMRRRSPAADALVLWALAFFLVYKDVWEYHYVMALPLVFALALRGPSRWPLILGAWLALPTPSVFYRETWALRPVGDWPAWLSLLHYGWKVGPLAGLYAVAWRRVTAGARVPDGRRGDAP